MSKSSNGKIVIGNLKSKTAKKKGKTSHQSAWFVTINTNVRFDDNDCCLEEYAVKFQQALYAVFDDKETALSIFKPYRSKVPVDFVSLRHKFQIEKSPQTQYLHAHGLLVVIHRSSLHIDTRKAQSAILHALKKQLVDEVDMPKPKNIYLHYDFLSDWTSKDWEKRRLEDYIEKNKKFDLNKPKSISKNNVRKNSDDISEDFEPVDIEHLQQEMDDEVEYLDNHSCNQESSSESASEDEKTSDDVEEENDVNVSTDDNISPWRYTIDEPSVKPSSKKRKQADHSSNIKQLQLRIPNISKFVVK